jgi:hypothetical protein
LTEVLVQLVVSRAVPGKTVVVVVSSAHLVGHWQGRLAEATARPIAAVGNTADLLEFLEEPPGDCVIVTAAKLQPVLTHLGTGAATPTLVVADDVGPGEGDAWRQSILELGRRATQFVVAVSPSKSLDWLEPAEIVEWPARLLPEPLRLRRTVRVHSYNPASGERQAHERARKLLTEAGDHLAAATRPALHASLLAAASRLSAEDGAAPVSGQQAEVAPEHRTELSDELLEAADALENLGPDGRLEAVAGLVQQARTAGRPCLVTVDRAGDAEYVAGRLRDDLHVCVVTASTDPELRSMAAKDLAAGGTVIGTGAFTEKLPGLPARTLHIWWSPPSSHAEVEHRLGLGLFSEESETVTVMSEPSLPGDRQSLMFVRHYERPDSR